jgi:hypothetical protein
MTAPTSDSPPLPVVVYGVKSSPDEKESVKDQHRQKRVRG